jgi:hypothetical protein
MFALGIGRCPDSNLFVRLAFEILSEARNFEEDEPHSQRALTSDNTYA